MFMLFMSKIPLQGLVFLFTIYLSVSLSIPSFLFLSHSCIKIQKFTGNSIIRVTKLEKKKHKSLAHTHTQPEMKI